MHFEPLDHPDRQKFEISQIQDGGGRHLENLKIVISQPWFERFRQNLVRWCRSTLLSVPTVKNFKFQNSKMAVAAILKNWKIAISRPRFNRFWRNLARWCISNVLTVPIVKNLKLCKSKMAAAAILKIEKQPYLSRGLRDLDEIWYDGAVQPSWAYQPLKISNFKNPRWRRPPSYKIAISRPRFNRFDTIWHDDAFQTSWPSRPSKI